MFSYEQTPDCTKSMLTQAHAYTHAQELQIRFTQLPNTQLESVNLDSFTSPINVTLYRESDLFDSNL